MALISSILISQETVRLFIQLVGLINFCSGILNQENKRQVEPLKQEISNGPLGMSHLDGPFREFFNLIWMALILMLLIVPI